MAFPEPGPNIVRKANPLMTRWSRWILMRLGWRVEGTLPNLKKFVIIGAFHTSNWDFFIAMAMMYALDVRGQWIAKHTIFRWPLGPLLRALGGRPVFRERHQGMVQEAIKVFRSSEQFIFAVTPEGTRSKVERWKTGFYHVAVGAQVVIVPAYFDYPGRRVGFGSPFKPTGDMESDLSELQKFYEPYRSTAFHPDQA